MTTAMVIGIVILIVLVWLVFKVVGFVAKLALYIAMALVAYWLFAQAFGLPFPDPHAWIPANAGMH
ncbi:MAG: hypothetical protein JSR70_00290 [Proteobacteria bacterium]|nr:hypothetical protein [Pseudomonadota bacterium]